MPDVTWAHPSLNLILDAIPLNTKSLIDVGCGRGIIGALSRIFREPTRLVGIDGHRPYLDFCERFRFYDECLQWDLQRLPTPFSKGEFDVVTCVEVIEHLNKPSGFGLLNELERIGRRVVVTTPNVFFKQAH